jgi:hypothetical protein
MNALSFETALENRVYEATVAFKVPEVDTDHRAGFIVGFSENNYFEFAAISRLQRLHFEVYQKTPEGSGILFVKSGTFTTDVKLTIQYDPQKNSLSAFNNDTLLVDGMLLDLDVKPRFYVSIFDRYIICYCSHSLEMHQRETLWAMFSRNSLSQQQKS